ncbi:MAG: hypothetical protein GVY19_01635 [Bacteroidetes bacterium]|jgi:hypothetical protein|nr:hypothetical protein [Bacteroidota bacterium]
MTYIKLVLLSVILVAILFVGLGIKLLFDKKAKISAGCSGGRENDEGGMGCACGNVGTCQSTETSSIRG